MKYLYPVVFQPEKDGRIAADVPDLFGCQTFGDDPYDAVMMIRDAMGAWLSYAEDEHHDIPPASSIEAIKKDGCTATFVDVDTDVYRKENDNRAVRKTLTIPSWLNARAERAGVNFSQVLQDALKDRFGIRP